MPSIAISIGLPSTCGLVNGNAPINLPSGLDQITISSSGTVKFFGGSVSLIECLTGTSVTLAIYDNPYAASGAQIYSGTLNEDDQVVPTFFAINGMYASITGTGSFRLTLNNN
jgi:hypothetical protein